jgi:hypothetical protein
MVAMKITLSAAMRARDVSRPRDEQLTEAAARDEALTHPVPAPPPKPPAADPVPAVPSGSTTRRRRRRER